MPGLYPVVVRSHCGARRSASRPRPRPRLRHRRPRAHRACPRFGSRLARPQGPDHSHERGHLACHHLGRSGRSACQPHPQPRRGPVRRGRIHLARSTSAGTPARALRPGRPRGCFRVTLAGTQSTAGPRATCNEAGRGVARRSDEASDEAHQGITGAPGREEAPTIRSEAVPSGPERARRLTGVPPEPPPQEPPPPSQSPSPAPAPAPNATCATASASPPSRSSISSGSSSARGPRKAVRAA
jgi:hypothetical protein